MNEMIERCIKAGNDTDLDFVMWCQEAQIELVTAIIKAMREPTDAMVQACRRSAPYDQDVTAYWPIAIDEALK